MMLSKPRSYKGLCRLVFLYSLFSALYSDGFSWVGEILHFTAASLSVSEAKEASYRRHLSKVLVMFPTDER
ncbi:hypothetical protein LY78DRAFT_53652 [Colletotrichum sublineola]|nr:hypothetical protein LY78DRAFT_53652 [Colletotrichum sublineola]